MNNYINYYQKKFNYKYLVYILNKLSKFKFFIIVLFLSFFINPQLILFIILLIIEISLIIAIFILNKLTI